MENDVHDPVAHEKQKLITLRWDIAEKQNTR